jgi:carbamoyltransferase
MKKILGISAFYHDSAAAIIVNGNILFAAQEERFTRIKHDENFPVNAIKEALKFSELELSDIDAIVYYEKPFIKFERILETYLKNSPRGIVSFLKSMPIWTKEKIFLKKIILDNLKEIDGNFKDEKKIFFSEHHLSHAASAFYPSPFDEAIILCIDAVGEWSTTSVFYGKENSLKKIKEINFPDSIGLLYSAFTYFLGFKVNSGEYKLMGLAPYGEPVFKDLIYENIIEVYEDGSFKLNMDYFNYETGLTMTSKKFHSLFGKEVRKENEDIDQVHMNIASSIQKVTEEILVKMTQSLFKEFKIDNLCLAGGVALNCVANTKILKSENNFKNIWVQPAAGDAGCSVGAGLAYNFINENYIKRDKDYKSDVMQNSFLGTSYTDSHIKKELDRFGSVYTYYNNRDELNRIVAKYISEGQAVGWFQGRMEFGPRALGNRSILADPRNVEMQKNLNLKIKFRESFRPFAPAVMEEYLKEWFSGGIINPYMLFIDFIKEEKMFKNINLNLKGFEALNFKRSDIPAVTHVDYSARVQSVNKKQNINFYNLIEEFRKITSVPVLINTSFNIRGEPIVCTIEDAFKCFMGTNIDVLVCESYVLLKNQNHTHINLNYKDNFKLD